MAEERGARWVDQAGPGQVVGRFEILSQGRVGRTGVVYEARERLSGRRVGLKLVHKDIADFPGYRERLIADARRAAQLDHPGVAPIQEVEELEGSLYAVMQWVEGDSLAKALRDSGRLDPERAVTIVAELAGALDSVHRLRGLVHGAIGPAEVLLEADGAAHLCGVGGAGALICPLVEHGLAELEGAYVSPEQLDGREPTPQSDLYALACLFFHVLTGQPPFAGASLGDLRKSHEAKPIPLLSAAASPAHDRYDELLRVALAPDPERRPASGQDFMAALLAIRDRVGGVPAVLDPPPVGSVSEAQLRAVSKAEPAMAFPREHNPEDSRPNVFDDDVQFTVYRPRTVAHGRWYDMLVFAHKTEPYIDAARGPVDPVTEVQQAAASRLGEQAFQYIDASEDSREELPRGSELTLVPRVDGVQFNPASRTFRWLEAVHQEEFRLAVAPEINQGRLRGTLSVYLGVLLIAEVSLSFRVSRDTEGTVAPTREQSRPYRKIFVSYSHQDQAIVEQVEHIGRTYGDHFIRDTQALRAGEAWDERLGSLIQEADVFQLFWSTNSMTSKFVQREWSYALNLKREHFVRPVYWERPLPERPAENLPPEQLRRLHFHYLPGIDAEQGPHRGEAETANAGGPTGPGQLAPPSPGDVPQSAGPTSARSASAPRRTSRRRLLRRNQSLAGVGLAALVAGVVSASVLTSGQTAGAPGAIPTVPTTSAAATTAPRSSTTTIAPGSGTMGPPASHKYNATRPPVLRHIQAILVTRLRAAGYNGVTARCIGVNPSTASCTIVAAKSAGKTRWTVSISLNRTTGQWRVVRVTKMRQ